MVSQTKYIGNVIKNFGIEKLSVCDAFWYLIDKYVAIFSDILAERTCMYNKIEYCQQLKCIFSSQSNRDTIQVNYF